MRLRKESDDLQEEEVLLIANVSDALAHPARIRIFRFIMKCNAMRQLVCNKDIVAEFRKAFVKISHRLCVYLNNLRQARFLHQILCQHTHSRSNFQDRQLRTGIDRVGYAFGYREVSKEVLTEILLGANLFHCHSCL